MERITVDLISSKEFTIEAKGYNRKEVDEFLDDICDEIDRMEEEIRNLKQRNAVERPAPVSAPSQSTGIDVKDFQEILEMARKVKDEMIQKAKEDAEKIKIEAETEVRTKLSNLDNERVNLENRIDALKKEAVNYREKFEGLLSSQHEQLKKFTDLFN